ncbi:ammonium transporter [Methanobrevibacter olleyae]|uniref:Ammonium transporter n=1 Tax=Methanobrevibacter olleyae TaxID=294671 RepID=A0A126QZ82_METOL|nr:ammonium transporter [Methanobrevibacter olleyae]AMK15361.1 ammonium transporter Amt [Methanobrevibacter olleyae]SFL70195.1 ammonium transporter, Amt family [Methanobrevibacter olleyae]
MLLDTGDTAWMLVSLIMVLLMTVPGIAFFYGGLSKRKNVLNTMFLSLIAFAIASIIWVAYGYQIAFAPSSINGLIGLPVNFFLEGIGVDSLTGNIPTLVYIGFQLTFAGLTAAIVSGSIVGRMKTGSWILFTILWISLVYLPVCHWIWGGGWLMDMGAIDFAGGVAVEINSGFSALALALVLGKRKDTSLLPHNLGYSILGAGFLWFGWMGFNGGSALGANGLAGSAILISNTAAAVAMITWVILDIIKLGKPTVLGAITGVVAGLVAITPAAGFVPLSGSFVIGLGAAIISYYAIYNLKSRFGYDDALDVFGVHGLSGVWGLIATGLFASPAINGVAGFFFGNPSQLTVQVISVVATAAYSFTVSFVIAKVLEKTVGLRVDDKEEIGGLDSYLHEESAYRL